MKLTCVVVDDEPLARAYLTRLLTAAGVTVAGEAGDASTALPMVLSTSPDIVILDIEMPGMNGLEFARQLRELNGSNAAVVFVTGYSEHAVDAFSHQATDYLLKHTTTTQPWVARHQRQQSCCPRALQPQRANLTSLGQAPIKGKRGRPRVEVDQLEFKFTRGGQQLGQDRRQEGWGSV